MQQSKQHWDNIYSTKRPDEVSWTQDVPKTSLEFIHSFNLPKSAAIIDVGGGDSKLVDYLLDEGFEKITVLDISEHALARAKQRLGARAKLVQWIVSDITEFHPTTSYDLWHDRATFHFLTAESHIVQYLATAQQAVKEGGYLIVGTFSTQGPPKCSGLIITQYSEETLTTELYDGFERIRCITEDHTTPFNTIQNFLFCCFRRKSIAQKRVNKT
jgi:ubiquinone/menaquinone biosynthesis C-methylase UbiE